VAVTLGNELLRQSVMDDMGGRTWGRGFDVALGPAPDAGIFNGRSGDALFLAALYSATGDRQFREAAMEALAGIRAGLREPGYMSGLLPRIGLGLSGGGSIVYALVRCAGFLQEESLLQAAVAASDAFNVDLPALDDKRDVLWGSAGAILGLLALVHEGYDGVTEKCIPFAEHLLHCRALDPSSGLRAWRTSRSLPESGFAHGSSGIACALLRLYRWTLDDRYYDAAIEAFSFERSLFRDEVGEWADVREQSSERVKTAWCHGSVGIGLARLEAMPHLRPRDEADVAEDLTRALTRASSPGLSGPDNLCCGSLGRIDFVLESSRRLHSEPLRGLWIKRGRRIVDHLSTHGYHSVSADENSPKAPGLWQGLSGVGYTLLRLARPSDFPSILVLG